MAKARKKPFKNPAIRWIDDRLPIFTMMDKEYGSFPTPRNFNYWWNFGALATIMLVVLIITGIVLAMHYKPSAVMAFDSVERIMRDVHDGWLIRYIHMNGASFFFLVVYIHMLRGLYYGSYKKPRELLWILGVVLFMLMMATAFMGYVLPWGQMSYWGATVITNFFSAIPFVGEDILVWLRGDFSVADPTLNRFFSLHYLFPFIIVGVVALHVAALHISGSNNPLGIEPKSDKDVIPFHPYYTSKDMFGLGVMFIIFAVFIFYLPDYLGHPDNYVPADPLSTPPHIVPEWYFLPFYAILRAVPDLTIFGTILITAKELGVLAMVASIFLLFFLPWLDTSPVRSARFRPIYKIFFWVLVADCVLLGIVGAQAPEGVWILLGQIATIYYFFFFLILLPILGKIEKPRPLPPSIHEAVLAKHKKA